jgi:TonB family protein
VQSSPVFDDAAESAIRTWRFRPAIMGHQPVAAWVTIPVRFVLNE